MSLPTVALIVRREGRTPENAELVEALSDEREIALLESLGGAGSDTFEDELIERIREFRAQQKLEDEDFGNYVEELVSKPWVSPEVQEHGIQWLKSKIRIESYEKSERDAIEVIARYAFRVYQQDPTRDDFLLAGPRSQIRVRVFALGEPFAGAGSGFRRLSGSLKTSCR